MSIYKMDKVTRLDTSETIQVNRVDFLNRPIGKVQKTDEGYLKGDAPIAKVGILVYMKADGSQVKELVPDETLFNVDSMASLQMKPITDTHPRERILDSKTVKRRKIGMTGEMVKADGDFLTVPVVITDNDAVDSVNKGRQELSPGYTCKLLLQPGIFEGQRYDAIQLERRYNHVALCDKARGGSDLRLNLDDLDVVRRCDGFEITDNIDVIKLDFFTNNRKGQKMDLPMIRIDGIEYPASQEAINRLNKLAVDVDTQTKRADAAELKVTTVTGEKDAFQAKFDTATDEVKTLKADKEDVTKLDMAVKDRINIMNSAAAVLDDKEEIKKLDGMTNAEIKTAVITKRNPDIKLDEKTPEYIDARFDAIIETIDFDSDALGRQRGASTSRGDSIDTVEKARIDSEEAIKNNYKNFGKKEAE